MKLPTRAVLGVLAVLAAYWTYELGWAWKLQGGLSRFCFELLEFNYDNGGGLYLTVPLARHSWVSSCKAVFRELKPDQQGLLRPFFGKPLPFWAKDSAFTLARAGRLNSPVTASAKSELREELIAAAPRRKLPKGPTEANLTRAVHEHGGTPDLDWLALHKAFAHLDGPWQEPVVEPEEVAQALKQGRFVRFDATKVLPPKTFNVTLGDISALHGEEGDAIKVLAFLHPFKNCRFAAYEKRRTNPIGSLFCPPPPTVGEVRRAFPDPRRMPLSSRIGLKRLPKYIDEDELLKRLSLDAEVERPEGQIIMGHANGDTHWDEQDNIFIQVSGTGVVFGVSPEYADAVGGDEKWSAKSTGLTWNEWLQSDEVRKNHMPYYYMVLKPGDGLAIPSRAFHAVYGAHNRASLQIFLEPKFNGMRGPDNKWSYWHKETSERRALRNIYFKTLGHLWDTKGFGMVAQGGIIEYL